MKKIAVFAFIAFCAVSALSLTEDRKKSKPSVTMAPAHMFQHLSTTTTSPNSTTTTPNTTTPSPNTTTTAPNTTTTAPNTTTTAPNTTTTAPNTTTTSPNTTTTAPNTTTTASPSPQPTPSTNLTVGNYTLMKDQVICLMAQMALKIRLETKMANGTFIVQPNLTSAQGECQETFANLTLVFKEGHITFMFTKSAVDDTVYVDALYLILSYSFVAGSNKYTAQNESVRLFAAKVGHSYSCTRESLYMGNGLFLEVSEDRMQAFNLTKSNDFGKPDSCAADQPDHRVAIAVGVTLLVLIVIVVVAYLLGRRKRTDGYQSL
uniref:Uncharacterized protein n=1 Tax=Mola mola TaxID=94237 RepID=A0A3Q3X7C0_MOLML